MPDQCYFNGNFYQCAQATSAGESPASAPAKWCMVAIPDRWRWVLARLTYANLLELDGQKDKANAERANAIGDERRGLDWMIRTEANQQRFLERPQVRLREFV
jgi:hypothetical protein